MTIIVSWQQREVGMQNPVTQPRVPSDEKIGGERDGESVWGKRGALWLTTPRTREDDWPIAKASVQQKPLDAPAGDGEGTN